jgi:hypothetical protein
MMAKNKATEKKVEFPKVLYATDPRPDCGLLAFETPAKAAYCTEGDFAIGIYELVDVARVTTEIKLTLCGPSKAGR